MPASISFLHQPHRVQLRVSLRPKHPTNTPKHLFAEILRLPPVRFEQTPTGGTTMLTIPHKKTKSHADTMTYLLDPVRLKSFVQELLTYLKSTQHHFQKEGFENDPRQCVHRGMYDRPEPLLFRRFNRFCTERGLDWEGAREMLDIMLEKRFLCECEMVWRLKDEQVEERLVVK